MKYLLLTLLLFPLSGFGEPDLYEGKLLKRDGLLYKPGSLDPFTGKNVLWHHNSQLLRKGSYKDGKKDGLFKYFSEDGVENSWSPQCWQNDKKVDLSICKQ